MRITINDVRRAGHCVQGVRSWFDMHGLNFQTFLVEGIEETDFLATKDALAEQVIAHKNGLLDG